MKRFFLPLTFGLIAGGGIVTFVWYFWPATSNRPGNTSERQNGISFRDAHYVDISGIGEEKLPENPLGLNAYIRVSEKMKYDSIFDLLCESNRNYKYTSAANAEELFNEIQDNTVIRLTGTEYIIDSALIARISNYRIDRDYGFANIHHVSNLKIVAEREKCSIISHIMEEPVILFDSCQNIQLEGLTLGHIPHADSGHYDCRPNGSVVELKHTNCASLDKCHLFGSGIYGLRAMESENIFVTGSSIYECSELAIYLEFCSNVYFFHSLIRDNKGEFNFDVGTSRSVRFCGVEFRNNRNLRLDANSVYENQRYESGLPGDVIFSYCYFTGNGSPESDTILPPEEFWRPRFISCGRANDNFPETTFIY